MVLLLVGLLWCVCGVVAYGAFVADFWYRFPTLHDEGRFRELAGQGVFLGLCGPIGLLVAFLASGFFLHGLLFSEPKADMRAEDERRSA
jgi:hypothetical protein